MRESREVKIVRAGVDEGRRAASFAVGGGDGLVHRKGRAVAGLGSPLGASDAESVVRIANMLESNMPPLPGSGEVADISRHVVAMCAAVRRGEGVLFETDAAADSFGDMAGRMIADRDHNGASIMQCRSVAVGGVVAYPAERYVILNRIRGCAQLLSRRKPGQQLNRRIWSELQSEVASLLEWNRAASDEAGQIVGEDYSDDDEAALMAVVDLPKVAKCDDSAVRYSYLPGARGQSINRAGMVRAVCTGDGSRLFRRRQRVESGGTILLDASGSMDITSDKLAEVCAMLPAVSIAYYSGNDPSMVRACTGINAHGVLCVYAADGVRADSCPHLLGGNNVDQYAIEWLLRQPAPRLLVSDEDFCCGPSGQDYRAHQLLNDAVSLGEVDVCYSFSSLAKRIVKGEVFA